MHAAPGHLPGIFRPDLTRPQECVTMSIEYDTPFSFMAGRSVARKPTQSPTEAELGILKVLWELGPCTLGEVWQGVRNNRPVARTTVATTLGTMLNKGLVRRKRGSQAYLWSASLNKEKTVGQVARQLMDQVFDGSARRLMVHLIDGGELSERDLDAIGRLVTECMRSSKNRA